MAKTQIEVSAEELRKFADSLDPKILRKLVKGTLRREAGAIRRAAVKCLRSAEMPGTGQTIRDVRNMEKAVRAIVRRDLSGLCVTANFDAKRGYGFTMNRRGEDQPLAFWMNQGTGLRRRVKGRRSTGMLKGIDYIGHADRTERPKAEARLADAYEKETLRLIAKLKAKL